MMKTTLELKGRIAGKEHVCITEFSCDPEMVFKENTLEGIFQQSTGFMPEILEVKNIRVERHVNLSKKRAVGTGFDTNDRKVAIEEGKKLKAKTAQEIVEEFLETLPNPDDIFKMVVFSLAKGDTEKAMALTKTFEVAASLLFSENDAETAAKNMLRAASELAQKIAKKNNTPLN